MAAATRPAAGQSTTGASTIPYKRVEILEGVPFTSGPLRALAYLPFLPLTWLGLLGLLLRVFLASPAKFLTRRVRRPEDMPLPPQLAGLVHELLDVGGGIQLHAVSFGRRPAKPLMLFLHGYPECWYSWRRQLVEYREEYDVVAISMRGYGWSSKPQGIAAYTLEHLTSDVAGAVAALGRTSCTLVAHDWGGVAAWAAAGRYPGLVDRLVVAAAPHWLLYRRNITLQQMMRSSYFLMFQMPIFAELFITHADGSMLDSMWLGRGPHAPRNPAAFTPDDVEVYKSVLLQPGTPTAALNYYRALMAGDAGLLPCHPEVERGLRRQLEMPVLVVWGADDQALLTTNLIGVAEVAPLSEVHILPACSHWIQSDQPEELSRVMREWLAAHPLPKGAA